jgi:hypothetical protein
LAVNNAFNYPIYRYTMYVFMTQHRHNMGDCYAT